MALASSFPLQNPKQKRTPQRRPFLLIETSSDHAMIENVLPVAIAAEAVAICASALAEAAIAGAGWGLDACCCGGHTALATPLEDATVPI